MNYETSTDRVDDGARRRKEDGEEVLTSFDELLQRVREEYGDTPNLRLTPSQAQVLFDLEPSACAAVLDTLLTERFLSRTQNGVFVRAPITN